MHRFDPMQSRFSCSCAKEGSAYVADRIGKTCISSLNWYMHESLRRIDIDQKGAIVQRGVCWFEIFTLRKSESERPRNLTRSIWTSHDEDKRWRVLGYDTQLKTWVREKCLRNVVEILWPHTNIEESTQTFKQYTVRFEATEYRCYYFRAVNKFKTRQQQQSRIPVLEDGGVNERHITVSWDLRGIGESQLLEIKHHPERTENLESYFCFVAVIS